VRKKGRCQLFADLRQKEGGISEKREKTEESENRESAGKREKKKKNGKKKGGGGAGNFLRAVSRKKGKKENFEVVSEQKGCLKRGGAPSINLGKKKKRTKGKMQPLV